MTWMLTGGAGYIGSHVARALKDSGRDVVVLDDLSTGEAGRLPAGVPLAYGSVTNRRFVVETLSSYGVTGVIHLAAKKAVGESVSEPVRYYRENVGGMISLLAAMAERGVNQFVYSSSAAVYGEPEKSPVLEDDATLPLSPYGETKLVGEWLCRDVAVAGRFSWIGLRYFNVAGAGSPQLGDTGVNNLIPIVLRQDERGKAAQVFGADYSTPDGTCIRDYIHVQDLAEAHVAAAARTEAGSIDTCINIGTGAGSSVLEVIESVGRALGHDVPHEIVDRRPGDPARVVASADRALEVLGWRSSRGLDEMTASAVEAWGAKS